MKKMIVTFMSVGAFVFTSCVEDGEPRGLIGRKSIIKYPEATAYVFYETESKLHWRFVPADGSETTGEEQVSYKKLTDELYFLNWIESTGITISQVIDTKSGKVTTFWSFEDDNSDRGKRSAILLEGMFSFDEEPMTPVMD